MLRARWLAAAVAVLSAASCTGGGGVSQKTGSASSWLTYTQPPGPMHLTFRYPPTWKVRGATLVSMGGAVGTAHVTGETSATIAAFDAVGCIKRVQLLHGSGVDVTWSASIENPLSPIRLSQTAGRTVRVNGHPARLGETKSTVCGPETLINGTIEMGRRNFLFMHAEVGADAKLATLAAVRKIFFSARP